MTYIYIYLVAGFNFLCSPLFGGKVFFHFDRHIFQKGVSIYIYIDIKNIYIYIMNIYIYIHIYIVTCLSSIFPIKKNQVLICVPGVITTVTKSDPRGRKWYCQVAWYPWPMCWGPPDVLNWPGALGFFFRGYLMGPILGGTKQAANVWSFYILMDFP